MYLEASPFTFSAAMAARMQLRAATRRLLLHPANVQSHLARIASAMRLAGAEPVQGALADLFALLGPEQATVKQQALLSCQERLTARTAAAFTRCITTDKLPRVTTLATRWSLLTVPSAEAPARARRCSPDDSSRLASQGVEAFLTEDPDAQQIFLDHCVSCHDKLAFMLARRRILQLSPTLPPHWETVSRQLEQL